MKDISIVVLGKIGLSGAKKIYEIDKKKLSEKYSKFFIKGLEDELKNNDNIDIENIDNIEYIQEIGEGGIYSSLWNLKQLANKGIEITVDKIKISQYVIEICELYNINPYYLESYNSYILTTSYPMQIIEKLKKEQIQANIIGKMRNNKKTVLYQQDIIRNLERARKDEIFKIIKEKKWKKK